MDTLYYVVVGLVAGWLAGMLSKGSGFGLIGNLIIGVVGANIGGWGFSLLGLGDGEGFVPNVIVATAGAMVLLWVLGKVRGK